MKKFVLIIIIAFVSTLTYAQLGFGIKGAITMSELTTDISDYENAAKTGFQLGAFVRIGDKWHLQPEVYFSGKAGEFQYDIEPLGSDKISVKESFKLNTIDVPVLIGYKLIDPPTLNVRLQAGPVASFVMNKKFDITFDGVSEDPTDEYKDAYKDMNWALQFGAGVDFLFLTVDVRYELGLNSIYDKPEGTMTSHDKVKNNVFFLSIGWKIL